jgi:hypothetical protein
MWGNGREVSEKSGYPGPFFSEMDKQKEEESGGATESDRKNTVHSPVWFAGSLFFQKRIDQ